MNTTEAFGLPPGSIRAILAIMLTVAVIAACFLPSVPPTAFATLGPLAGMAIQAYFSKDKPTDGPQGNPTVNVTGDKPVVNAPPPAEPLK